MKNKRRITIGIILIISAGLIYSIFLWMKPPNDDEDNNALPNVQEDNQDNFTEERNELESTHEQTIFFIENPKYELVNEEYIQFFQDYFPEHKGKWNQYAYTITSYLYGMITENSNYVLPHFKPDDLAQAEQLIQENMPKYKGVTIEDIGVIAIANENEMLLTMMQYNENVVQERILVFNINDEKITLDEEIQLDQLDQVMNFYYNLPPIEELLDNEKFAILHENLLTHIDEDKMELSVKREVADSLIYYLNGLLTRERNLVASFIFNTNQGAMENDLLVYGKLNSHDIELMEVIQNEENSPVVVNLQFTKEDESITAMFEIFYYYLIEISNRYDI